MSIEATAVLAVLFLIAIPINVQVAWEVRRYANMPPHIGLLTMMSWLVNVLTFLVIVLCLVTFSSVVFLLTGARVFPALLATSALVVALIVASFANLRVRRYLRQKRGPVSA